MPSLPLSSHGLHILVRRGHLRQVGTQMLAVAAALLLSAVLLLGVNVSALYKSFAWVQRTNDTLVQISEIEMRLIGNELTVRGYALTDDPVFLTYQKSEQLQMTTAMRKLAALVAEEDSQIGRFAKLRNSVDQRMSLFAYLTGLGPGHAQDVKAAILDHEKRVVMRDTRALLADMRAQELKLLVQRQAETAHKATRTYGLAIGIVILAFVFSALGLAFMLYGRSTQRDFARGS
jgi:CHASE3 domain sensor protein